MSPWSMGLPQPAPRYYGVGVRGRGNGSRWWLGRFWAMRNRGYYRLRFELSPLLTQTLLNMGFVHRGIAKCTYVKPLLLVQPTQETRRRRYSAVTTVSGNIVFEAKIYFTRRRIVSSGTFQHTDHRPIYNTILLDLPSNQLTLNMIKDMGLTHGSYIAVDIVDPRTIAISKY